MSDDVETWTFGPTSQFLVGPIVGRVTEHQVRILIESANDVDPVIRVTDLGPVVVDGQAAQTGTADPNRNTEAEVSLEDIGIGFQKQGSMSGKTPTVFTLSGLPSGHRVRVSITLGNQTRSCSFRTVSDRGSWDVGVVSCNNINFMKGIGLWEDFCKKTPHLDCVVHVGDQVYGDEDFSSKRFRDNCGSEAELEMRKKQGVFGQAKALVRDLPSDQWEQHRSQIQELYRELYRQTWNHKPTAAALASTSNVMMLDDHEIVDNLGDLDEHKDPSTWNYFIITCGYQVYLEYEQSLNYEIADTHDYHQKAYWHTMLFPRVGLYMVDARLQRSLHRQQMKGMDWTDHEYIGPGQMQHFKSTLEGDFAKCTTLLMGCTTPPLFLNAVATTVLSPVAPDVIGSWGNKAFKAEQREFLQALSDWQGAETDRAVCMAGGDIHIGGFADVQLKSGAPLLNQITSSAIGNVAEGNETLLKALGTPILKVSDAHFSMRVNHPTWVFEPNFGIVRIRPPRQPTGVEGVKKSKKHKNLDIARPAIRAELFSKTQHVTTDFSYSLPGGISSACHGIKCVIS